jgi:hypothetical protein
MRPRRVQSAVKRSLATLVALWFVVLTSEPAALHACAVHDGGRSATAHAAPHDGSEHGTPHHPGPTDAHHCACLGDCCAASPVAVASRIDLPTAALVAIEAETPSHAASMRAPHRPFSRPPSTGPPPASIA